MFLHDILVSVINVILVLQDAVSSIITRELDVSAYGILHIHWLVYLHVPKWAISTRTLLNNTCLSVCLSLSTPLSLSFPLPSSLSLPLSPSLPLSLVLFLSLVLSTSLYIGTLQNKVAYVRSTCLRVSGVETAVQCNRVVYIIQLFQDKRYVAKTLSN